MLSSVEYRVRAKCLSLLVLCPSSSGSEGGLGTHGAGSLRLDLVYEALLVWAARESFTEPLGASLTE